MWRWPSTLPLPRRGRRSTSRTPPETAPDDHGQGGREGRWQVGREGERTRLRPPSQRRPRIRPVVQAEAAVMTRVAGRSAGLVAADSPRVAGGVEIRDGTQESSVKTPVVAPAKLRPPRLQVPLVTRRALLDELMASTQPLVVVCAPAGSGKSVALMQWVEADPRPAAWVQLDSSDDDVVLLLSSLCEALEPLIDLDPGVAGLLSLSE